MDSAVLELIVFLTATFVAALVAGLAGFAFGLVAAAAWLHVLTPLQTASLIIGYGLIVQGWAVWKLRRALSWNRLWPFLLGAAVGVPLGTALLTWVDPKYLRAGMGAFLVLYGIYGIMRPALKPVQAGAAADMGAGFFNGMLGGMTGLAGIVVTIWSGLRGWPKDVQRTVFQPVSVATFAMSAMWIGGSGAVSRETGILFLTGLPILLAGTWLGLKLYGRLDEASFRKIVLFVLLLSGAVLMARL
jgi:hypothetical protein